ncbi:hypothetical protein AB0442_36110 [Kitasatospora sp. NPDC085895]
MHITNANAANIGMFYLSMFNVTIRRFPAPGWRCRTQACAI